MVPLSRLTWDRILVIVSAAETSSKTILTLQCNQGLAEDRGRRRAISVTKQVSKSQKQPSLGQYMLCWSHRLPLPLWYTALFLLIWWDTQEAHQDFFSFVPLSLLCCNWFIFSTCKTLCKGWALYYISCEQGEMLLSTCQGAVLHRITENRLGKTSQVLITRTGSALPNLPCLLLKNGRDSQTSEFNLSHCSTIPNVRKRYNFV